MSRFAKDGFGNLADQTGSGSAPNRHYTFDGNNHMTSPTPIYDVNGNQAAGAYNYDAENRLYGLINNNRWYAYDAQNKRVWQWGGTVDGNGNTTGYLVNFYGVDGKRLAQYQFTAIWNDSATNLSTAVAASDLYFGARRLAPMDRLGSVGRYYPYGEDKGTGNPGNDNWKFGTYLRDGGSGLDYADQRYYSSGLGRFMTPDPSEGSGNPKDPHSWNRYSYVQGDPVNFNDPRGQLIASSDACLALLFRVGTTWDELDCQNEGGGGGGLSNPYPAGMGFVRIPSPFCTVGVGVLFAPPAPPPKKTTECALSLSATTVFDPTTGLTTPFKHTALVETKATSTDKDSTSITYWLEAYNEGGYLNSAGGEELFPGNGKASLWTPFWNYGFDSSLCDQFSAAQTWADSYSQNRNNTIRYVNTGPNSNTWVSTLQRASALVFRVRHFGTVDWGGSLP